MATFEIHNKRTGFKDVKTVINPYDAEIMYVKAVSELVDMDISGDINPLTDMILFWTVDGRKQGRCIVKNGRVEVKTR